MKKLIFAAAAALLFSMGVSAQKVHRKTTKKVYKKAYVQTKKYPLATYFAKNVGKYPGADLHIWDKTDFTTRVAKILGDRYQQVGSVLTTETPIVSDGKMYKFSGCEAHNCAGNKATYYYDPKNDNIMVLVEKNQGSDRYSEKGRFWPSEKLEGM